MVYRFRLETDSSPILFFDPTLLGRDDLGERLEAQAAASNLLMCPTKAEEVWVVNVYVEERFDERLGKGLEHLPQQYLSLPSGQLQVADAVFWGVEAGAQDQRIQLVPGRYRCQLLKVDSKSPRYQAIRTGLGRDYGWYQILNGFRNGVGLGMALVFGLSWFGGWKFALLGAIPLLVKLGFALVQVNKLPRARELDRKVGEVELEFPDLVLEMHQVG